MEAGKKGKKENNAFETEYSQFLFKEYGLNIMEIKFQAKRNKLIK